MDSDFTEASDSAGHGQLKVEETIAADESGQRQQHRLYMRSMDISDEDGSAKDGSDEDATSSPKLRSQKLQSVSSSSGASAVSENGPNGEMPMHQGHGEVDAASFRQALDEVVESGDRSEHAAKLRTLFPILFRSTADNGINEPLNGLLVESLLDLAAENNNLKKRLDAQMQKDHPIETQTSSSDKTRHLLVHQVTCKETSDNFLDVPRMFKGDTRRDHLRGRRGIASTKNYMKDNTDLDFLIIACYDCWCNNGPNYHRMVGYQDGKMIQNSPPAQRTTTDIFLGSRLETALVSITRRFPERFPGNEYVRFHEQISEPYIQFYCYNNTLLDLLKDKELELPERSGIRTVCNWFEDTQRKDWNEADALFAKGKVSYKHIRKLFRPGDIVAQKPKDSERLVQACKFVGSHKSDDRVVMGLGKWSFNGHFTSRFMSEPYQTLMEYKDRRKEVDITSLSFYPARYVQGLHERLITRGLKFWRFRKPSLVSFADAESQDKDRGAIMREHRHMIDYKIFRSLYPKKDIFKFDDDHLGQEEMNKAEPPDEDFLALLPPKIHAFDLASKSWKHLPVDRLTDVTWNRESFQKLVIPPDTKELIQAAVTSHGQHPSAEADVISEKGQGLLLLLHGGPGTGKTLTAETIAEEQGRPLYRVTCGDIGIEPRDVEMYLKSVLVIGKAWGCVVLLDEADVFLEERRSNDPKQNAIVSIFLRVLEYYDGIMILTTNRVGSFDEAFKSRIHLAIHYEDLDEEQRLQIWKNFIEMLGRSKERIDTHDLSLNVNKLAQEKLNGRQIRNVIMLARYLARFRKEMMRYQHVQDALKSVVKFEKYLVDVRGSDEDFARQERLR